MTKGNDKKALKLKKSEVTENGSVGQSNASNYTDSVSTHVDTRTGVLALSIVLPSISSITGHGFTPSASYSQKAAKSGQRMLGLPYGWSYNISYIYKGYIYINGEKSYLIDGNEESGMQYYRLKNVILKACNKEFPYDKSQKYYYVLKFLNGDNQYFDSNGRLIGIDDKYGNHVLFSYTRSGNIYKSGIANIIRSDGQEIKLSVEGDYFGDYALNVEYPKGTNNIKVVFNIENKEEIINLKSYTDPEGNETTFEYTEEVKGNLISKVIYANGLETSYEYGQMVYGSRTYPQYMYCVTKVHHQDKNNTNVSKETTYEYNGSGGGENIVENYTGYPLYNLVALRNEDSFLLNGGGYHYQTTINDGLFITEHTYNHLHLAIEKAIFTQEEYNKYKASQGNAKDHCINYVKNTYNGETKEYSELPVNYQMPKQVDTTVYDDDYYNNRSSRTYRTKSTLDDYGNVTKITKYESSEDGNFTVLSEGTKTYSYPEKLDDNKEYGHVTEQNFHDYKNNKKTRIVNSFTSEGKNISSITNLGEDRNGNLTASKVVRYEYDNYGRKTLEKLEWAEGSGKSGESSQKTYSYEGDSESDQYFVVTYPYLTLHLCHFFHIAPTHFK